MTQDNTPTAPPQPPVEEIDPKTGIHMPEIADAVYIESVVLKGSGTYADGEIFTDVVYRAPKRIWMTEMKGTVEGFKAWMSKHDPRLRTAEEWTVEKVREEATDSRTYNQRPAI